MYIITPITKKLIIDSPPTCNFVAGPKITSSGLEANESTGNLIDMTKTHKRGNTAIKHQRLVINATVILSGKDRLNILLSMLYFFFFLILPCFS